jgi:histone-lysine N-methyltransferase SETD2
MLANILLIDENVTGYKEEDCFMDPTSVNVSDYLVDPSTSLPSYKPVSGLPSMLKTNYLAGSFNSIGMIEPSELRGNGGNNDLTLYSSEMQNHHSSLERNLNQKTETKKASRNKGTSNKISDLDSVILKANRKSRTFSTRSRTSGWGWGSFAQIFQQSSGVDDSKVEKKKSRKPKGKREKQSKNLINEEIISMSATTTRIRLKVKMGKQVIQSCLPETENDAHKYPQPKFEFPKSEFTKVDFPKVEFPKLEFPKLTNSVGGRLEDEVFLNTEYQFSYEDLDKNISGKVNGISTCDEVERFGVTLDSRCLDPGTSPDSEVINQTPEASISRKLPEDLVNSAGFFEPEEKTGDGSYYSSEASISDITGVSLEAPIDSPVCRVSNIHKGRKIPKSSKPKGSGSRPKGIQDKSVTKHNIKENADVEQMSCKVESLTETNAVAVGPDEVPGGLLNQHVSQRNAWVRCDDCYKWRRIAAALADAIEETSCKWVCKDNNDTEFADCSIPQEKSNSAINAELEISDASCEEDACTTRLTSKQSGQRKPKVPQNSSWKLIRSNIFLHRNRKAQTIDEIMVCHCKQSLNGRMGCGDGCLNRLLNIECVKGTCPCGELCSNQQFQKRKYAKLESFRCGKKGHGLRLLEDIPDGGFLIEYVGEVLDTHAYEARQKEYALNGHKHFYFMTLNGSEVIDACAKGNLGRFINHSCEPNCRTEKWMVNGEVCVGLFAMRDIKKGEEVTFDYNYVRVFGAAAKKCVCNSSQCRGYIGGDPNNNELIVQGDSDDDEYPEPVMIYEDGDRVTKELCKPDILSAEDKSQSIDFTIPVPHTEVISEYTKRIVKSENSMEIDQSVVSPEASRKSVAEQKLETTCSENTIEKSLPDIVEIKKSSSKSQARTKTARSSSSSVKKVKAKNHAVVTSKLPEVDAKPIVSEAFKPKKMFDVPSNSTFEAVQVKLNELLDAEGGISRRKDASRGYLKLLFLTAASGDTGNGETIQSTRDLSMILDAILKTRSRSVLVDVINKNGAQMLHNIMKRYRREFKKIPILRKLLKILEFLASREILTLEHISRAPPCAGAESLRESILTLTEHNDRQVHLIARKFRDTFIPRSRSMRKVSCPERDFGRNMDHHQNSNNTRFSAPHRSDHSPKPTADPIIEPVKQIPTDNHNNNNTNSNNTINIITNNTSSSCTTTVNNPPPRIRKRKSRWDEPDKPNKEPRIQTSKSEPDVCQTSNPTPMDEDLPPGFSPSVRPESEVVTGEPLERLTSDFPVTYGAPLSIGESQKKYISKLPVSYGIPLAIVQQFGSPNKEILGNWAVAPGTPFQPFPPLPTYPRPKKESSAEISKGTHFSDPVTPSTSGAGPTGGPADFDSRCSNNQHGFQRAPLGRKYFRQQKFNNNNNNPKFPPPWVRSRINTGFIGGSENQHHQMPPQLPPPGYMGMEGPDNCFYPPSGPMMPPPPMYHQPHHQQQQNWHY